MKLKYKEKTSEELQKDLNWLFCLSEIVIISSVFWLITKLPSERFTSLGLIIYNIFLKVGTKNPEMWKYIFYIALIGFAIEFIIFAFELIVKLYFKVQQLKGGIKKYGKRNRI